MPPKGVRFSPFTASSAPSSLSFPPSNDEEEDIGAAVAASHVSSLDTYLSISAVDVRDTNPSDIPHSPLPPSPEAIASRVRFQDNNVVFRLDEHPTTGTSTAAAQRPLNDNVTVLSVNATPPSPSIRIHPSLARSSKEKIVHDISKHPTGLVHRSDNGEVVAGNVLDEAVVEPLVDKLLLVCDLLPVEWKLEITGSSARGYVSVGDLLKGLYQALQVEVTEKETRLYEGLSWEKANTARKGRIADSDTPATEQMNVLRLDFLCGKNRFCGIGKVDTKELMKRNPTMGQVDPGRTFKLYIDKFAN